MILDYIQFCKYLENISILQLKRNIDHVYYSSLVYYAYYLDCDKFGMTFTLKLSTFLNQAHAWFLKIAFVQEVSVCVCVCVYVSTPEAIHN